MCAQRASTEKHRFIVGTCSLHDNNELSVLNYIEESNHFEINSVYGHPDQVMAIESSPKSSDLVVTSRQSQKGFKSITLWKMQGQSLEDISSDALSSYDNAQLELSDVASFNQTQSTSIVSTLKWHKLEDSLLTVDDKVASVWAITESGVKVCIVHPRCDPWWICHNNNNNLQHFLIFKTDSSKYLWPCRCIIGSCPTHTCLTA